MESKFITKPTVDRSLEFSTFTAKSNPLTTAKEIGKFILANAAKYAAQYEYIGFDAVKFRSFIISKLSTAQIVSGLAYLLRRGGNINKKKGLGVEGVKSAQELIDLGFVPKASDDFSVFTLPRLAASFPAELLLTRAVMMEKGMSSTLISVDKIKILKDRHGMPEIFMVPGIASIIPEYMREAYLEFTDYASIVLKASPEQKVNIKTTTANLIATFSVYSASDIAAVFDDAKQTDLAQFWKKTAFDPSPSVGKTTI